MFEIIFLIKFVIAILVVLGLSLLAEYVSPKIAGILSGFPTGSAITLFFYGLEISPEFASESAIYNMIGLTASLSFIFFYYKTSIHFKKFNILLSSIFSISAYLTVIYFLHFIEINKFFAFLIPLFVSFIYLFLFKKIKDIKIKKKIKINKKIIFLRAILAASIILLITSIAQFVGPKWAGLFSAFPTTLFPLILIIHFTYSKEYVYSIIKNVPIGIFSLIIYSLTISIVYPLYNIYLGTIISLTTAMVFLIIFYKIININKKD